MAGETIQGRQTAVHIPLPPIRQQAPAETVTEMVMGPDFPVESGGQTITVQQPPPQQMTYAAPQQMVEYAAPQMTYAAPQMVEYAAPQMTYAAPQTMTYAAPQPMTYAAPAMTYAQPASAFDMIDRNHDGVVTRAEFAQMQGGSVSVPAVTSGGSVSIMQQAPVTYAAPPTTYAQPMMAQPMMYAEPVAGMF